MQYAGNQMAVEALYNGEIGRKTHTADYKSLKLGELVKKIISFIRIPNEARYLTN
jgi:hypothetical protein